MPILSSKLVNRILEMAKFFLSLLTGHTNAARGTVESFLRILNKIVHIFLESSKGLYIDLAGAQSPGLTLLTTFMFSQDTKGLEPGNFGQVYTIC